MKQRMVVFQLLIALIALSGCSSNALPLNFQSVAQSEPADILTLYRDTTPATYVLDSATDITDVEKFLFPDTLEAIKKVDFNNYFVLVVFRGKQPSTGYSIKVDKILLAANIISVYVTLSDPAPDIAKGEIATTPFHIVAIERGKLSPQALEFQLIQSK